MTQLLRPKTFAQRLGVHVATVYRMVAEGVIEPPRRLRGKPGQRGGVVGWTDAYAASVIARLPRQQWRERASPKDEPPNT